MLTPRAIQVGQWLGATALLWFNNASYLLTPVDDERYYTVKAHALMKGNEYSKAIKCLQKVLRQKDSSTARGQIAGCYYVTGEFQKALDNYQVSYRLNRRANVALGLVMAALKCGQFDVARTVLEQIRNSYDSLDREDQATFTSLVAHANCEVADEVLSHVACPHCKRPPRCKDRWRCSCGNQWNTFDTRGRCPACDFQWAETACPVCNELSPHSDWYI
jgi:tetratricopeptide (TPR) repeat protein